MKTFLPLLSILSILSTLVSIEAMADNHANKYTVGCQIHLIGGVNGAKIDDQKISQANTAAAGPSARFDLGGYVLSAYAEDKIIKSATGDVDVPTLTVEVIKKNADSPVASQINYATTPAIMEIGDTRSISSLNFLKLDYNGQTFSRIDYTCVIARAE